MGLDSEWDEGWHEDWPKETTRTTRTQAQKDGRVNQAQTRNQSRDSMKIGVGFAIVGVAFETFVVAFASVENRVFPTSTDGWSGCRKHFVR